MAAIDVVLAALLQCCFSLMHISAYYSQRTALEFYSQTCSSHFGMDGIFSGDAFSASPLSLLIFNYHKLSQATVITPEQVVLLLLLPSSLQHCNHFLTIQPEWSFNRQLRLYHSLI